MNEIIIDGSIYNLIGFWKKNKSDKSVDSKGNNFIIPKNKNSWTGSEQFIHRLKIIQEYIEQYQPNRVIRVEKNNIKCLICYKNINMKKYIIDKYIWDDTLIHYIEVHNFEPHRKFIDKIFELDIHSDNKPIKLMGRIISEKQNFIKLEKNQIMIIDALMKHGGYNKKYYDMKNSNIARYSEHAGFLDVRNRIIYNIVVSGNTLRVDRGDEEIFLPMNTPDAFKYEYIFHTHPPTPKPGGRSEFGILYEFPSLGDIFHFIDHTNDGNVIGSLVMTSEGLYNIRKNIMSDNKINIDEELFYVTMKKTFRELQRESIKKYGTNFSTYKFYSTIAQNRTYIDDANKILNKFGLHIDFFPRKKDFKGSWIVDTVYIPI